MKFAADGKLLVNNFDPWNYKYIMNFEGNSYMFNTLKELRKLMARTDSIKYDNIIQGLESQLAKLKIDED